MKSFPMFLTTTGRRIVIAGGGEQAAQKARLALKTDAGLDLIAPALEPELQGIVASGRGRHIAGHVKADLFHDTALTFVATGCPGADVAWHALAKARGAVVNVVDRPELCDATTPSIVDRDPVVVAIGTEGTAPVLARDIKTRVEALLSPRLGAFAALAGRLRAAVADHIPTHRRRAFWAWAFKGEPARIFTSGDEDTATAMLKTAIADGRVPGAGGAGHIALIGAGPGARDLLTLRAVERLQEADVIFYDRLVDPDVLELARRDAERVFVGKEVGACAWPQDRINALIVAEARKGRRIVRLKSGDAAIFGRATEEIEAARHAGITVEIVPGVTAAAAAAATLQTSLTERGEVDAVVLATGMCRPGDPPPDLGNHVRPGTVLAVYMGVTRAAAIAQSLIDAGAPADSTVDIACDVSSRRERVLTATLKTLSTTLRAAGIRGSAVILIRFPKSHSGNWACAVHDTRPRRAVAAIVTASA